MQLAILDFSWVLPRPCTMRADKTPAFESIQKYFQARKLNKRNAWHVGKKRSVTKLLKMTAACRLQACSASSSLASVHALLTIQVCKHIEQLQQRNKGAHLVPPPFPVFRHLAASFRYHAPRSLPIASNTSSTPSSYRSAASINRSESSSPSWPRFLSCSDNRRAKVARWLMSPDLMS